MWFELASLLLAATDVDLARSALAGQLKLAPEAIHLRSSRSAQWADSALGCSKKGEKTTPSITRGTAVLLEAGGQVYPVHVSGGRAVICEARRGAGEEKLSAAARLNAAARQDLARRLRIGDEKIETRFMRPTTWPDASLGCPQPGMMYAQMETSGFIIELESGGKTYRYHADLKRAVPCDENK